MGGLKMSFLKRLFDVKSMNKKEEQFKTVRIGEQDWMRENLDIDYYRSGDPIPEVQDQNEWAKLTTGAWCYYNNDKEKGKIYGKLYNWYAVIDPRGLAPDGWHVPTDDEWKQLEITLGMSQAEANKDSWRGTDEGGKMKEDGKSDYWKNPNKGGSNKSGFSARPGGWRDSKGFTGISESTFFWSATATKSGLGALKHSLNFFYTTVGRSESTKKIGCSVRLVKGKEAAKGFEIKNEVILNKTVNIKEETAERHKENTNGNIQETFKTVNIGNQECMAENLNVDHYRNGDSKPEGTGKISHSDSFIDIRDGYTYRTVKIGNQLWMAENLRATRFRNGDEIPEVKDDMEWRNLTKGAYCNYGNNKDKGDIYGRLYNYYTIMDERNICPEGWHVPTYEEWRIFNGPGNDMKKSGYWKNSFANNSTGFSAISAGVRAGNGTFKDEGYIADFWSSTQEAKGGEFAWHHYLEDVSNGFLRNNPSLFIFGFSIRCVKD